MKPTPGRAVSDSQLNAATTVGDLQRIVSMRRYAAIKDRLTAVIERRRGKSFRQVARVIRRSVSFAKTWNDRFKREGASALALPGEIKVCAKLSDEQRRLLKKRITDGPTAADQVAVFTVTDIRRIISIEFEVRYSRNAVSRLLRRLGLVRLRPRPRHQKQDPSAFARWRCETFPQLLHEIQAQHPERRLEVWYQDESRFGQKTRSTRVWAERGSQPVFSDQNGKKSAYIFGAVNPLSGARVGLVTSHCDSDIMQLHLDEISRSVDSSVQVALVLDGAGWHFAHQLNIPKNISLCRLPPYSPELNPIERLWLWIKRRHLSFRHFADTDEIIAAGVNAWNMVTAADVKSVCRDGAAPTR